MTKYEYSIVPRDGAETIDWLTDMLNEMGERGWKLCQLTSNFFLFERELEDV